MLESLVSLIHIHISYLQYAISHISYPYISASHTCNRLVNAASGRQLDSTDQDKKWSITIVILAIP